MRNITHRSSIGYDFFNNKDISERKLMFIKTNMTRDIYTTSEWVKILVTFIVRAITQKYTMKGESHTCDDYKDEEKVNKNN